MIAVLEKIWLDVVMAYYPGIRQEELKIMNEPQDVVCHGQYSLDWVPVEYKPSAIPLYHSVQCHLVMTQLFNGWMGVQLQYVVM